MKSKLVILSLMVAAASTATAQTKEKFVSEKASDNIFVSVGVGASASMYKEDGFDLGKAISPHVTISLGKWFTPVWAVRGQIGLWNDKVNTGWGESGAIDANGYALAGEKKDHDMTTGRIRLDGMFNLSNAFCGYNPDRLFNLSVFAGPGLTIAKPYTSQEIVNNGDDTWSKVKSDKKTRAYVNGSVGLQGKFNLNKYWDIDLEARGELSPSYFGTLCSANTTGNIYLTAGVTYTFGGKKFISCGAKVDQNAINEEVNKYRTELAQAQADLADAKNALANVRPEVKEVTKEVQVAGPRAIFFRIGSARIDDYGKVNIQLAAKILKANPDKKYKVAGYADKATGSSTWNQKLSEKRAQAVYDALIKEGVDKDQLELVGFGGTANMFGKNYLNRVVIME
ncbi:MAG: OmpA family protein [Bacteroides sp.]|jgi:outer membrane protein OmpA-like peptidoglycan-associated protein|nr:OmpA family protein [Bacteroides sp.]MCI1682140.1 OmpA family protein [Bacteroides sp.]